jgi:hypothetical protein
VSISAIDGVTAQAFTPTHAATKPASAEVAGAPNHDGDSDDRGTTAVNGSTSKYSLVDRLA